MKTFLIDTNIILRLVLADVPFQNKKAREIFRKIEEEKQSGIISLLVINELVWVLENFYQLKRSKLVPLLLKLLSLRKIKIKELKKADLLKILKRYKKSNLDFTDLYLLFFGKKERLEVVTFDKKLMKKASFGG